MKIHGLKRHKVFTQFNSRCAYCGIKLNKKNFQTDHIISRKSYFSLLSTHYQTYYYKTRITFRDFDNVLNLFPSCGDCNRLKSDMSIEEFRCYITSFPSYQRGNSSIFRALLRFNIVTLNISPLVFYFETFPFNSLYGDVKS